MGAEWTQQFSSLPKGVLRVASASSLAQHWAEVSRGTRGTAFPLREHYQRQAAQTKGPGEPSTAAVGEGGGAPCAVQRALAQGLITGPISCLCPGPDLRPGLLVCTVDRVMDLTLLRGREDAAEVPGGGESQARAASDSPSSTLPGTKF